MIVSMLTKGDIAHLGERRGRSQKKQLLHSLFQVENYEPPILFSGWAVLGFVMRIVAEVVLHAWALLLAVGWLRFTHPQIDACLLRRLGELVQ